MDARMPFSVKMLEVDCAKETEKIATKTKHLVSRVFKQQGVIVALAV